GLLPGVAVASLLGGNLLVGAVVSAAVMTAGVTVLGRAPRLSQDTGIGLLFVGMLSLGVIIVSRSQSFAVDLTGFLFGDVLAVRESDLTLLGVALSLALGVSALGHRAFLALAFDERKARTLGLRPRLAHAVLLGLLALAIVASFHVVGTLLVLGLLIAPPAAALPWARSVGGVMVLAAVVGAAATFGGLLLSWHLSTAAGATVSALAVCLFFLSHLASGLQHRRRARRDGVPAPAAPLAPKATTTRPNET
ncbi:metal ABC transporter permease, partial [Streptomyces sp. AC563]